MERLSVKPEETNGSLLRHPNHEEFVIGGDHYVADVVAGVRLAILAKLNRPNLGLILDIQREVPAAGRHNEGLVVLNVVQGDYLRDGDVEFAGLERHALELSILDPVGEDLAGLGADHKHSGVSVEGGGRNELTRVLKFLCHLDFEPARVEVEAVAARN